MLKILYVHLHRMLSFQSSLKTPPGNSIPHTLNGIRSHGSNP